MHDEFNPKVLANDRIYPFALQYHEDVPYLANHDKYSICFDSVLDWQMQVTKLRNLEPNGRVLSHDPHSFSPEICKNSFSGYSMPEYFVLRYYHPGNLMYKKIIKWMDHPFIKETTEEGEEITIKLLPYM